MNYEVKGVPFPVAVVNLESGESIVCQKGAMSWMSPNMLMETGVSTDGKKKGFLGGIASMAKSAVTGESFFRNTYTAQGGSGMIAFAATVPGNIICIDVAERTIVAQKGSFLACSPNVSMEIFFQNKSVGAGFFGGEGFIMQKFLGKGMVFLELDGSIVEYDLNAGESMLVDTGYLAAMDATCSMSVESVGSVGNALLGGEGLFNTRVTGPGHIWLQTMPLSNLAGAIGKVIPKSN